MKAIGHLTRGRGSPADALAIRIAAVAHHELYPGKLPELGNALGSGLRELRRALNTDEEPATPAGGPTAESVSAPTRSPCQGCGAVSLPEARYCTQCGQKLAA
jgi:hypothetical protein